MATTQKKKKKKEKGVTGNGSSPFIELKDGKEIDTRLIGYNFIGQAHADKTPLDYAVDPETGQTENGQPTWGIVCADLRNGIEGATLPPLFIWKNGRWLDDFDDKDAPLTLRSSADVKSVSHATWVTHGEGTPGGYSFRAFIVPSVVATDQIPKHPMIWKDKDKTGKFKSFEADVHWRWRSRPYVGIEKERYHDSWILIDKGFLNSYNPMPSGQVKPIKPPAPKAVSAPPLPLGIRFRCSSCGHWFKESDLKVHNTAGICPGKEGGTTDWAVMCDQECGCSTLDQAASCKPGFPRPKPKEVKPKKEAPKEAQEGVVLNG